MLLNKIFKCLSVCTTQLLIFCLSILPLRCFFIAGDAVDKEVGHEFDQLEDHDDGDTQKETESAPEAGEKTIQLRKKGITQPMAPFFWPSQRTYRIFGALHDTLHVEGAYVDVCLGEVGQYVRLDVGAQYIIVHEVCRMSKLDGYFSL